MSWIDEHRNRVLNEDTIVKPWRAEQFIKFFEYLIANGAEEFTKFAYEIRNLPISEKNCLRMIEVHQWFTIAPTKEKWKEILERYPNIKKFLEDNDMLDRRELCSNLYYDNLFDWDLSKNPNLAKTFKENMEKIKYLNADVCWHLNKDTPFMTIADSPWSFARATYDITDEEEKLIFLEKIYCGLDLEYHLLHSRFTEKNGRKYRHDIFDFEYEKANEKYAMFQSAGHGWALRVINNGTTIKKMMAFQGFRMANCFDGKCHNLPSLEEVERFDLTDEMKSWKKNPELTEIYLKRLKNRD